MKHRTREGEVMEVSQMEDDYLMNMIRLVLRNAEQAKLVLDGPVRSRFSRLINDIDEEDDVAEAVVERVKQLLPGYLFEAVIRGLDLSDITARLQGVFGRSGCLPRTGMRLCLDEHERDDFEDDVPF